MSARDFATDPFYARLRAFLDAGNRETDRGRALVAASLIEEMLEEIVMAFLVEEAEAALLFRGSNAPLASLYSRNILAFSLGLIYEAEFHDVNFIRKIRNKFAHNMLCSFADPDVRSWSLSLKSGMALLDGLPEGHQSRVSDPKARFSMVSSSIVCDLYNRAYHTKKERRITLDQKIGIWRSVLDEMEKKAEAQKPE